MTKQEIIQACKGKMPRELAVAVAETEFWNGDDWTLEELFALQVYQSRLVMDFSKFHEAAEATLKRPSGRLAALADWLCTHARFDARFSPDRLRFLYTH